MVDYLKITSLAAKRVEPELVPWQVSHDFIELGDDWTEIRKVRVFRTGPSLKGRGDAAHYPYGLDGTPPPPSPACKDIYDSRWNEDMAETWSPLSHDEFEAHFSDPDILDRLSPLTTPEDPAEAAKNAVYSHWHTDFSSEKLFFPTDIFDENVEGRIVRRVEILRNGVAIRDNLYIQRRREFSIVFFNGSLGEGEPRVPDFDRTDISLAQIDRNRFEKLYKNAAPKIDYSSYVEE